jgi:hypothetical protein
MYADNIICGEDVKELESKQETQTANKPREDSNVKTLKIWRKRSQY